MQQGAQTLFVMPKLAHHPAVPAQGEADRSERTDNIDYLLGVSVLKENGINPTP